ncbi:hypothetical protein C8R45DRAFT_1115083 [Mycena sanguinolenta]|nr:hypothetical protein C8R45DRAFT_1115083 [Mycena sanguinolenta]
MVANSSPFALSIARNHPSQLQSHGKIQPPPNRAQSDSLGPIRTAGTPFPPFTFPTTPMTTFTTAANTATDARDELTAVLATVDDLVARTAKLSTLAVELQQKVAVVDELVVCAARLSTIAVDLQEKIPVLCVSLREPEAAASIWVPDVPKTPAQVAALHANLSEGSRHLWVVYVGREPGVYTTIEAADQQIKGCPNQQYRRKTSKQEALQFYAEKYAAGAVKKYVEVIAD